MATPPAFLSFLLLLLLTPLSASHATAPGLTCKHHPFTPATPTTPVLIRSWTTPENRGPKIHDVAYIVRHTSHRYVPISNPASAKYAHLDLFFLSILGANSFLPIQLFFQRPAKVYLFAPLAAAASPPNSTAAASEASEAAGDRAPRLDGWKAEGYASLVKGAQTLQYGVHQKWTRPMPPHVFVFSKLSAGSDHVVNIPSSESIVRNAKHIDIAPYPIHFWVAEKDGKPSKTISKFRGATVKPNARCPDQLHDEWVAYDDNPDDKHTKGVKFPTWHPAWDPCFWCAYDHEHGASAKHLIGFTPRYGYTSYKINDRSETHQGFKTFVAFYGRHAISYTLHVQASKMRRMKVRFHSIELAITDAKSRKLLYHVRHKADFGFLAGKPVGKKGVLPLSSKDEALARMQRGGPRRTRAVNVINVKNLNPDLIYRAQGIVAGTYEEWDTVPICASTPALKSIKADLEFPQTGIRSGKDLDTPVILGRHIMDQFRRNDGISRLFRFNETSVGAEHCDFEGDIPKGYFYTDINGTLLKDGPGRGSLRQYIKPGFKLKITGKYETKDPWLGLYKKGYVGKPRDHGFGIDPDVN